MNKGEWKATLACVVALTLGLFVVVRKSGFKTQLTVSTSTCNRLLAKPPRRRWRGIIPKKVGTSTHSVVGPCVSLRD